MAQPAPPSVDPSLGLGPANGPAGSGTQTVTYMVWSDAASVATSWTTPTGAQQASAASPWVQSVTGQFAFESVAASMTTPGTTISCSITVDGTVITQQTNNGTLAVVTCYAG